MKPLRNVYIFVAVAAAGILAWRLTSGRGEYPAESQRKMPAPRENRIARKGGDASAEEPQKFSENARKLIDALKQKLEPQRGSGTVDLGGAITALENYRLNDMGAGEILAIIDTLNFGTPSLESQDSFFALETIAEILRDKTTNTDVAWIDAKLQQAKEIWEKAKWLKVLESVGYAGNEAGFIQIFNNLPEKIGDDKSDPKSELVGRVLGGISSETAVRTLLAAANEKNEGKQVAIERSAGYVHTDDAIRAISQVLDAPGPKSPRQVSLATQMLGSIPSEYSVAMLRKLEASPDPEIGKLASHVLSQLLQYHPGLSGGNKSN